MTDTLNLAWTKWTFDISNDIRFDVNMSEYATLRWSKEQHTRTLSIGRKCNAKKEKSHLAF